MARYGTGALRDLRNDKQMGGAGNDQHALSEVLSGALYSVLIRMHNKRWEEYSPQSANAVTRYSKSGKALWVSSQQFKRMTLRALDYLPPGEITFADYGRAVIAADQVSHPNDVEERTWLKQEFVTRGIVADEQALEVMAPDLEFADVDIELLVNDDMAARSFAEKHRKLLRIPDGSPFEVGSRLKVTKKYYHRVTDETEQNEPTITECLFKVWWPQPERNLSKVGTTLAIDWATRKARVLLTSDHSDRPAEAQAQQAMRGLVVDPKTAFACCRR